MRWWQPWLHPVGEYARSETHFWVAFAKTSFVLMVPGNLATAALWWLRWHNLPLTVLYGLGAVLAAGFAWRARTW